MLLNEFVLFSLSNPVYNINFCFIEERETTKNNGSVWYKRIQNLFSSTSVLHFLLVIPFGFAGVSIDFSLSAEKGVMRRNMKKNFFGFSEVLLYTDITGTYGLEPSEESGRFQLTRTKRKNSFH